MSISTFYPLAGHVYTAAHSAKHHKLASVVLGKAGFGQEKVAKGLELTKQADALLEKRELNYPDDKNLAHTIHSACEEVERWLQSVKFRLKKAGFSPEVIGIALGTDLHAHDHNISVISQSLRAIAIVRTMENEHLSAIGRVQSVRDMLSQGNTLLKKLYRNANNFVGESYLVPKGSPIIAEFDALNAQMATWLGSLDAAAQKIEDHRVFGLIGYTPVGVGLPVGGTGFNITLHERAQTTAPDPRQAVVTSGWSVGRQGNNENVGQGWLQPDYGTVTGD